MAEKIAAINRVSAKLGEINISSNHRINHVFTSLILTERKHIMTTATATYEIKIFRIKKVNGNNRLKAYVDILINDAFIIKNLKVIEGDNGGLFVGMPSSLNKSDNKWYEAVRCNTREIKDDLTSTVLAAYSRE